MNQSLIFIPFFGLMLLTISVWFYMYYLRISYLTKNQVDPQKLSNSRQLEDIIPEKINSPSENLNNLFELPVLFYATCLFLYTTNLVDTTSLLLAYLFLLFRIIHSVIHCTYNKVMHRFYAYILSSIVLWIYIVLAFVNVF
ncbi:MAG: MAPEG family protein [Gammaproteobacteria bacterium]|nr:MAPEG family protein [Gammaproteobacteria bacterium]